MSLPVPKLESDATAARQLFKAIDAVLFDCDGVLWNGAKAIEGTAEVIKKLTALGKKVILVTNNSRRTREEYHEKVKLLGFDVPKDAVYCTSTITALYLKGKLPEGTKIFIVAEDSVATELSAVGFQHIGVGPRDPVPPSHGKNMGAELDFTIDSEVGAVVVGYDRYFNLVKCNTAMQYLSNPKVLFIATNTDAAFPLGDGRMAPGTGCIVAAVKTGAYREPLVMGKPEKPMFEAIQAAHKLDPSRTLMVGDRLETDILFGKNNGMKTIAVLTGVVNLKLLEKLQDGSKENLVPDYYCDSVASFLPFL